MRPPVQPLASCRRVVALRLPPLEAVYVQSTERLEASAGPTAHALPTGSLIGGGSFCAGSPIKSSVGFVAARVH